MKGKLDEYSSELAEMVKSHPDATLSEYGEYFGEKYNVWVSVMCCALQKQKLTRKKRLNAVVKRKQKESKN